MRAPQRMTRIVRVQPADVLVVFGITGDLAKVMTDGPPGVHAYAEGSWRPAAGDGLLTGQGAWHEPWVAA
jgi:glucose-6-phosphate 1-dehydrogenase